MIIYFIYHSLLPLNLYTGCSMLEAIGKLGLQYGMVLYIDMFSHLLFKNITGDDFYLKIFRRFKEISRRIRCFKYIY